MLFARTVHEKSLRSHTATSHIMDIDDVYTQYAEFGTYQKKLFAFLATFQAFLALHQVHNIFVGAEPKFCCLTATSTQDGCPDTGQICSTYRFYGDDFTSIVSEWNLVCGDSYKASLIQSVYMAGIFVGSFLFGKLADKYGRKPILCIGSVDCGVLDNGMAVFSLAGMVSQSYEYYVTMRFITAIFNGGVGLVTFVMATELIGASKRSLAGVLIPTCFGLGITLFAILGHLFRDWRVLTLICSLPGFVGIYWHWFFTESPRWLYSQNRVTDAERALDYIIACNGGPSPAKPITLRERNGFEGPGSKSESGSQGFAYLFKEPLLRRLTLNNAFTWFMNCCTYYGLTMGAGSLGSNMYSSVALSGLVELPAYFAALFLIESRLGRRYSFSWTMLVSGVVCALMLIVPLEMTSIRTTLALIGKMAVSISFSVAWLFSAELYPTFIRNQGVSVCTGSARIGGILSPLLLQLGHTYPNVDYLVFGTGMFLSGILAIKLPETRNKPMPETINDLYDLAGQGHRSDGRKIVKVTDISEDKVKLLQGQIELQESDDEEMEDVLFSKT